MTFFDLRYILCLESIGCTWVIIKHSSLTSFEFQFQWLEFRSLPQLIWLKFVKPRVTNFLFFLSSYVLKNNQKYTA